MPSPALNPGDPIWYRLTQPGGYGFQSDVPGFFVRATRKRLIVRVFTKAGTETLLAVLPTNVRPRDPEEVWK